MNAQPPFPPVAEAKGLGADWRDHIYTSAMVAQARNGLMEVFQGAMQAQKGGPAADALTAWLDSWALEALVEVARRNWVDRVDGAALAVLYRASEVLQLGLGLGRHEGWVTPDEDWSRQASGEPTEAPMLPPFAEVTGGQLAGKRAELCSALVRGEIAAVRITTPVPLNAEAQLALGEIRMEGGDHQQSLERFGLAGLLAGQTLTWDEVRVPAPPGEESDTPVPRARGAVLPGRPVDVRAGKENPVGVLMWAGPHPPVFTRPEAIAVLGRLDGTRNAQAIAEELKAPLAAIAEVIRALVQVGAAGPPVER